MAGVNEILGVGEEAAKAVAGVFVAVAGRSHGEGHVARLGFDAEFAHQAAEVRVGPLVVNDKAGVDGQRAPAGVHDDRVGVAAEAGITLKERHFVATAQVVGRGEP